MPTAVYGAAKPHDIDPRRWARCLTLAEESMIAQGRHPRALCPEVRHKRALRFWAGPH